MTDLATLGIRALTAGYQAGTFTPTDVMHAVTARIAAWEPHINALYAYAPEAAAEQAAAATQRWQSGHPLGPLDGVPVTIKEMIPTAGTPTPLGTAATELIPAAQDAPPAARLREAGAVIFAKTTAPDYGMLSSGVSSFHGITRNPWNLATNPGGSSSGAAAAAAAGLGPLHLGTDIGGSIRLPAAWCGLAGLKPSLGRIPIDPYYLGRCAGPMARSVEDLAFAMVILSQPDARDATSLPPAAIDWHTRISSVAGLRIGLMLTPGTGFPVDPEITDTITRAAALFAAHGAIIHPIDPVLTPETLAGIDQFWRARLWADLLRLPDHRREKILPFIATWAGQGAHVSGAQAVAGLNRIFDIKRACAALFTTVDAVLSPTTPNLSFPAENASPLNDPDHPFGHIGFTLPWNMSEQPALSLNAGFSTTGTPIGLQIITPRFADSLALQLGFWFEHHAALTPAWPAPPPAATHP